MYDVDPCPTCQTRSICYNGIQWTCEHCVTPIQSPVEVARKGLLEAIRTRLKEHMGATTIDTLLEGLE